MSRFLHRAVLTALVFLSLVLPAVMAPALAAGGVNLQLPSVERRQAPGQGALHNFLTVSAPAPGSNMSGAINTLSGTTGVGLQNVGAYSAGGAKLNSADAAPLNCSAVNYCTWTLSIDVTSLPAGPQNINIMAFSAPPGMPGGVTNTLSFPINVTQAASATISYIGSTYAYNTAATGGDCSPAWPKGTGPGDLALAWVANYTTAPGDTPAGWAIAKAGGSNLTVVNGSVQSSTLYYEYFTAGDSAPNFTNLSYAGCTLRTYRGVSAAPPFIDDFKSCVATGNPGGGGGATFCTIPSLANTTNNNEMAVAFFGVDQEAISNTMTGPSGFGNPFTFWQPDRAVWAGDKTFPSSGSSSGVLTASITGLADLWEGAAVSLIPTGGAPTPAAPAFTAQPANITVAPGQTATFTARISGYPTPSLQWQRSADNGATWANVSGATAAAYTTPAAVSGDNGALFSLTATNSQGSATSRNATLTVNPAVTSTTFDQFGLPNPPPAPNNKKAIPAVAFNTSIGANVCGYAGCCAGCTPGSGSQATDINQISFVGVKTLRFGGQNTNMSWAINIAKATGAKYCYLANRGYSTSADLPSFELANLKTLKAAGVLLCAEGLNEPENEGQQYNGQTCGGPTGQSWQPCAQFMKDLHALIRADSTLNGIALLGISNTGAEIGNYGLQFAWSAGIPSGSGTNGVFPTGTVFSDGAVLHTYLSGGICSNGNCPANLAWDGADPCVNRPAYVFYKDYMNTWWGHYSGIQAPQACDVINTIRVVTESDVQGAFNAGLEYQGVQITNMYINFFMRGIKFTERFGIIEGVFNTPTDQDHPNQQHQGFYAKTLTPYPSANYVHSMTHFLTDTGDVPNPGTVDWSFGSGCGSGGASGDSLCHGLLLQKSPSAAWNPNSYDLLLTYDPGKGGPGLSLPVNLGQSPFSRVNVYDLTTVVSPSQNSPVNPTPLVSCQNCGSITIPWSATGVHAGAIPPPLVVEMIP